MIVDPDRRGRGIGRALAQHAVLEALTLGLRKMVVEVVADQEATIAMFRSLGFEPEALLKDHVRDQAGELRDLMVLAHSVEESFASMAAVGLGDAIGRAVKLGDGLRVADVVREHAAARPDHVAVRHRRARR